MAMMRWLAILVFLFTSASAQIVQFSGASVGTTTLFAPLKIGAGGYITGIDIAADGTKVNRTDTWGAYVATNAAPTWVQLVRTDTMPAGDVGFNNTTGDPRATPAGVYEIVIAPSDTNTAYMHFNGYVYKTSNLKAATPIWTRTNCAQASTGTDANTAYKWNGKKLAIDPQNSAVFISGTGQNGVRVSTDSGTTCTAISGITAASTPGGLFPGYAIVADPTSAVSGGIQQGWYISSYGTGVYHATNGPGGTYSLTTGTPTTHNQMSWQGGALWLTEQAASDGPWRWSGSAWSHKTGTGSTTTYYSVAVDPANSSRILIFDDGGRLNQSTDGGATWLGAYNYGFPNCSACIIATDVPWLQTWTTGTGSTYNGYITLGNATFDPSASNKLYQSTGTGVYWGNLPSTYVAYNITSQSAGIEQLVANNVVVPPGGRPVAFNWDRPIFYSTSASTYPSGYSPSYVNAIDMGWSGDWSPQTNSTMVCLCNYFGPIDFSSKSTDGGQTWTVFAAKPSLQPGSGQVTIGGSIAAASDSHYIIVQNNGTRAGVFFTTNSGASWTEATVGGVPSVASGNDTAWGHSYSLNRRVVTCDKVTVDLCWLDNPGLSGDATFAGVYQTTNGGSTWARVFSGVLTTWSDGSFNAQLRAVPTKTGHIFYTGGGSTGSGAIGSTQDLKRSSNSGTTWTSVPNVKNVYAIGYGKAVGGGAYPAIFIAGFVTFDGGTNYAWGVYRSTDGDQATPTWTLLANYPLNSFDTITWIEGDMSTYGDVYVGFRGSGYAYGHLNYLLDPANDNTPMWLEKVA